jgi:hypothetical protein
LLVLQFEIVALNIVVACFLLGSCRIFGERSQTKLAIFNEAFIMVLLYHFMCFTPFVSDMPARIQIGFSFCILESLNLLVNLLIISGSVCKGLIFKFKIWRAYKKLLTQKQGQNRLILKKSARSYFFKRQIEPEESEEESEPVQFEAPLAPPFQ